MNVIPIFYDTSSLKSLLVWAEDKYLKKNGPVSIVNLCKEANLTECVFVSNNMESLKEAYSLCKKAKIHLIPGVEILMCDNAKDRSVQSRPNEHKAIVFLKESAGYEAFIKLYSAYQTNPENISKFPYVGEIIRFDYVQMAQFWSDNLLLAIPFFDSFIARNLLTYGANIMPDLSFAKDKVLFREVATEHPYEKLINEALDKFNVSAQWEEQKVKTIYYKNKSDFDAYITYRCIFADTVFSAPELGMMCSNTFCFESWKENK